MHGVTTTFSIPIKWVSIEYLSMQYQHIHTQKKLENFVDLHNMKNQLSLQVSKITNNLSKTSMSRLLAVGQSNESSNSGNGHELGIMLRSKSTKRVGLKMDNFVQGLREHVRLASKLTESMKGKLSLGAKIIQLGGVENAFKNLFGVGNGEKLLKASQCYLSTTAGPIAGLLFISNFKIAFFSERSIKIVSPTGKILRLHYKVSIPCIKIARANGCENEKRSSQKYIQIITDDNFEFWFMGFLNLQKTLEYLQQVMQC